MVALGYRIPNAIRRVDISKPQGGTRMLGMETLTDRLMQQALHQILRLLWARLFGSELRLSSGVKRASGRQGSQAIHIGREKILWWISIWHSSSIG